MSRPGIAGGATGGRRASHPPSRALSGPLLTLDGVWAGYGERTVLRGVSITVPDGELVGLVGPNGSGKTTLLRVASGVLPAWRGSARALGREVASLGPRERARTLAVVTQSPVLPEEFIARDLVLWGRTPHLGLLGHEGPRDLAAARRAMELTETWALAERRIPELSGGERQKLAVARALAQETPLLLVDEPTAHLDIKHQTGLFDLLRRLLREGVLQGVLAAVHDLTLAGRYADRLALLDEGAVAAQGSPAEVLTQERVARVYGVAVAIIPHPATLTPAVIPLGGPTAPAEGAGAPSGGHSNGPYVLDRDPPGGAATPLETG